MFSFDSPAAAAGTLTLGAELTVNRLGYGAMRLAGPGVWGPPVDPAAAVTLLKRVIAGGVNFIDTSDAYGPHTNETLIAEALYPYPAGLVIATKGGLVRNGPDHWGVKADPVTLRAACEGSLQRLRLDTIDVYQLHAVDPHVPIEESVGALADLQIAGKIRAIGLSNVTLEQLDRAREVTDIASVQNRYNIYDRSSDDVLRRCEQLGIPFLPWFPLAMGQVAQRQAVLAKIAHAHQASQTQIALAWLLQRSPIMLPIPGTASLAHFEENLAAASLALTPDEYQLLTAEL